MTHSSAAVRLEPILREPWQVRIATRTGSEPLRQTLESLVRERYQSAYGADIQTFLPVLMGVQRCDRFVGAIGARSAAGSEPLLTECYVDVPIERALLAQSGHDVPRSEIYEVGNLAATQSGFGPSLVLAMAEFLRVFGGDWVVFAATTPLRSSLARLGAGLFDLGPADPTRLPPSPTRWGSYYATDPRVCAVNLTDFLGAVAGTRIDQKLSSLWAAARRAGVRPWSV